MISKIKGGKPQHARILGVEVIKYFLDGIFEGNIKEEDLPTLKLKTPRAIEGKKMNKCERCDRVFQTEQGLKTHITRTHVGTEEKYCDICKITLKTEKDFKAHMRLEHEEIFSPQAKKRKRNTEEEGLLDEEDGILADENLKVLEEKSWEEMRMKHREIEIQVNEEELVNMSNYDLQKRETEVTTKLSDVEAKNDEKVLEKQRSWFDEEVKYQEMKNKLTEDRLKEEKKRKRQLSIAKKKKSKSRKEKSKIITDMIFDSEQDDVISVASEEGNDDGPSPGYMGWKSSNDNKMDLMNEFNEIRKDIQELKTGDIKKSKQIKSLEILVKSLENEYKQCLEALSKETYERNKAEEINKILLETIEAKKRHGINEENKDTVKTPEEEMLVDHENEVCHECEHCKLTFKTQGDLEKHTRGQHGDKVPYTCKDCQVSYKTQSDLEKHIRSLHVVKISDLKVEKIFTCETCYTVFKEEDKLKDHLITLHAEKVFTCQICNKSYSSMSQLRRHDWRSHREIECNICGDAIQCRQDIKNHRQSKHQMFKRIFCKYYPACIDGDECFFEHEKDINVPEEYDGLSCPNGEKCKDQTCKFSEQRHSITILCKFQANCNRLNCQYKHNLPRKAFLGGGSSNLSIN